VKSPCGVSKRYGTHFTQPRFVYEHVWKLGDSVMWANTEARTMHRLDPFYGESARSFIAPRSRQPKDLRPFAA